MNLLENSMPNPAKDSQKSIIKEYLVTDRTNEMNLNTDRTNGFQDLPGQEQSNN